MKKFILALGMLIGLAAMAAGTPAVAGSTLGVVSLIGDSVTYQWGGLGPKTDISSAEISAWGLDGTVAEAVKAKLGARFTVAPVTLALAGRPAPPAGQVPVPPKLDEVVAALRQHPLAGADFYLLVVPDTSPDFIGVTNLKMTGLGIYRRFSHGIQVYAVGQAVLLDGHSFNVLQRASLRSRSGSPHAHGPIDSDVASQRFMNKLSDDQKAQVKTALQELLRRSLDFTLQDMNFGG